MNIRKTKYFAATKYFRAECSVIFAGLYRAEYFLNTAGYVLASGRSPHLRGKKRERKNIRSRAGNHGSTRGSVHGERAEFTDLVLGFVKADFCDQILVGKLSPRSVHCTPFHNSPISFLSKKLPIFEKITAPFTLLNVYRFLQNCFKC